MANSSRTANSWDRRRTAMTCMGTRRIRTHPVRSRHRARIRFQRRKPPRCQIGRLAKIRSLLLLAVFCVCTPAWATRPVAFSARRDYAALGWVALGDVNGDGIPDTVAVFGGIVRVLLGNGNGTFRTGIETVLGWQDVGPPFALSD